MFKWVVYKNDEIITGNKVHLHIRAVDDSHIVRIKVFNTAERSDRYGADISKDLMVDVFKPLPDPGKDFPAAYTSLYDKEVDVLIPPGSDTVNLSVQAFDDDDLRSEVAKITLHHRRTPAQQGRLLGLCVGMSDHLDPQLRLQFANQDAIALADLLNHETRLYREQQVEALTDRNATRENMLAKLDHLIQIAMPEDTAIISVSGHGGQDSANNLYLATYETDLHNLGQTTLSWDDFGKKLSRLAGKCKTVIVLLDVCHGGAASAGHDLLSGALGKIESRLLVFAGCQGGELSREIKGHGAFTQGILDTLTGPAGKPSVELTFKQFTEQVESRVLALTKGTQRPAIVFQVQFDGTKPFFCTTPMGKSH